MAGPETPDELPVHPDFADSGSTFTAEELDFLAVAEGFVVNEFVLACAPVALRRDISEIPPEYTGFMRSQGIWDGEYGSFDSINATRSESPVDPSE